MIVSYHTRKASFLCEAEPPDSFVEEAGTEPLGDPPELVVFVSLLAQANVVKLVVEGVPVVGQATKERRVKLNRKIMSCSVIKLVINLERGLRYPSSLSSAMRNVSCILSDLQTDSESPTWSIRCMTTVFKA